MGMSQSAGRVTIVLVAIFVTVFLGWYMKNVSGGRQIFAAGSDPEATRLAGINPDRVVLRVYCLLGAMTGLAAVLNAVRFNSVPGNAGIGLEMKVIAAAVVGGATITGGRATMSGTVIGTILLGVIGTALTFAGISPFWEKAVQGAIIVLALCSDLLLDRLDKAATH
jgi:rhamnose transport system permease protein